MTASIFHILTQTQWQDLDQTWTQILGQPVEFPINSPSPPLESLPPAYTPPSLAQEGFIHLSTLDQVCGVADRFYQNQGDLVLLEVDPQRLQAPLRWEAPIHPDGSAPDLPVPGMSVLDPADPVRFPHLYGPLNWDAIVGFYPLKFDHNHVQLPPELQPLLTVDRT